MPAPPLALGGILKCEWAELGAAGFGLLVGIVESVNLLEFLVGRLLDVVNGIEGIVHGECQISSLQISSLHLRILDFKSLSQCFNLRFVNGKW